MTNKIDLLEILEVTKELKILYVEDNEDSRTQALKMFHNYFTYIDVAVDGTDGLELYKSFFLNTNNYYDLVITDIHMPKMNGINMCKNIYNINKNQKIIIISAYSDKNYFIDLIKIGVNGFIQKPISFEQLLDALKELCKSMKDDSIITLSENTTYNKFSKELFYDSKIIHTTINENKFIEFLIKNHKSTSTLEDIFNYIYYDEPQKEFSADSIKSLVKRLRKKIPKELIAYNSTTGYYLLTPN